MEKQPETVPVSFRFDSRLNDEFAELCKSRRTSKTQLLEDLIRDEVHGRMKITERIFECTGVEMDDVQDVTNHAADIEHELNEAHHTPGFPCELKWAMVDYLAALWRRRQDMLKSIEGSYRVVRYPYVHFNDLGNIVEDAAWNLVNTLGTFSVKKFQANDYFDVTEKRDLLYDTPLLFAFPFYLTEGRRNLFGVLPYGDHLTVGLLLHKELYARAFGTKPPQVIGEDLGLLRKGFNSMLAEIGKTRDGRIYYFRGFIYDEILPQLASTFGAADTKQSFYTIEKHSLPVNNVSDLAAHAVGQMKKSPQPKASLFVLDLIIAADIEEQINSGELKDFTVLRMPHGQKIPVGIGFTLPLLPRLLHNGDWKSLLDPAKVYLASLQNDEQFQKIGIKLRTI